MLHPNNILYLIIFLVLITCLLDSILNIIVRRIYILITPGSQRVNGVVVRRCSTVKFKIIASLTSLFILIICSSVCQIMYRTCYLFMYIVYDLWLLTMKYLTFPFSSCFQCGVGDKICGEIFEVFMSCSSGHSTKLL